MTFGHPTEPSRAFLMILWCRSPRLLIFCGTTMCVKLLSYNLFPTGVSQSAFARHLDLSEAVCPLMCCITSHPNVNIIYVCGSEDLEKCLRITAFAFYPFYRKLLAQTARRITLMRIQLAFTGRSFRIIHPPAFMFPLLILLFLCVNASHY